MDDLERAILDAFKRLYPRLLADRAELAKRLARRNCKSLRRPPRAWCLALRANDRRLLKVAAHVPVESSLPQGWMPSAQQITLTAGIVGRLCSAVRLDPPGEPVEEVAEKLGVTRHGLLWSRLKGDFRTHHLR